MGVRKPLLSKQDIQQLFAAEGNRWPVCVSPESFAAILGLKSVKTISPGSMPVVSMTRFENAASIGSSFGIGQWI
jgi:2-phospho-L-lactate guanylyltransferase (CobY/MobA/RfbA family)